MRRSSPLRLRHGPQRVLAVPRWRGAVPRPCQIKEDAATEGAAIRHVRRVVGWVLAGIGLWGGVAFCLEIPRKADSYVNDYSRLLSDTSRSRLETALGTFEKETSNQVVVAIFDSLDGQSLEDFSVRLAQKWKIGQKGRDNGVLLLIFKNDRQVRIEVGYGLEGVLPDAVASQIIRNEITPAFRAGDYDRGVESAVEQIFKATRGEYKGLSVPEDPFKKLSPYAFMALLFYIAIPIICYALVFGFCFLFFGPAGLLIGAIAVAILILIRRIFSTNLFGSTFSGRFGWYGSGRDFGGGFSSGGFGGFGGGGGGFGGGGASGGW